MAALLLTRVEVCRVGRHGVGRLHAGDAVLVDRVTYLLRLPYRGEIVDIGAARHPDFARVVGISGDTVERRRVPGGNVLVNRDVPAGAHQELRPTLIPLDHIRGRALFVLYPLSHRGWLLGS